MHICLCSYLLILYVPSSLYTSLVSIIPFVFASFLPSWLQASLSFYPPLFCWIVLFFCPSLFIYFWSWFIHSFFPSSVLHLFVLSPFFFLPCIHTFFLLPFLCWILHFSIASIFFLFLCFASFFPCVFPPLPPCVIASFCPFGCPRFLLHSFGSFQSLFHTLSLLIADVSAINPQWIFGHLYFKTIVKLPGIRDSRIWNSIEFFMKTVAQTLISICLSNAIWLLIFKAEPLAYVFFFPFSIIIVIASLQFVWVAGTETN